MGKVERANRLGNYDQVDLIRAREQVESGV